MFSELQQHQTDILLSILRTTSNQVIQRQKQNFRDASNGADSVERRLFIKDVLNDTFESKPFDVLVALVNHPFDLSTSNQKWLNVFIASFVGERLSGISTVGPTHAPKVYLPDVTAYHLFFMSRNRFKTMKSSEPSGFFVIPVCDAISNVMKSGELTLPRLFDAYYGMDKRPIRIFNLEKNDKDMQLTRMVLNKRLLNEISTRTENGGNDLLKKATALMTADVQHFEKLKSDSAYSDGFLTVEIKIDRLIAYHSSAPPNALCATSWNLTQVGDWKYKGQDGNPIDFQGYRIMKTNLNKPNVKNSAAIVTENQILESDAEKNEQEAKVHLKKSELDREMIQTNELESVLVL
jgi:hypothetical protein